MRVLMQVQYFLKIQAGQRNKVSSQRKLCETEHQRIIDQREKQFPVSEGNKGVTDSMMFLIV